MSSNGEKWRSIVNEIFNMGREDLIDEILAPDYVEYASIPPGWPSGLEGFKQWVRALRAAFPDLRYEIDEASVIDAGEMQAGSIRAHGTMQGEFMGFPATGREASWDESHIGRFEGGRLKEHWGVADTFTLLQQLGVMPGPGEQAGR